MIKFSEKVLNYLIFIIYIILSFVCYVSDKLILQFFVKTQNWLFHVEIWRLPSIVLTKQTQASILNVLQLRSFSNLSITSPTSQLILQPFRRFTYVTVHSPTLPLLHLRHSLFSNPSFASLTSQALHLRHLASRLCYRDCGQESSPGQFTRY